MLQNSKIGYNWIFQLDMFLVLFLFFFFFFFELNTTERWFFQKVHCDRAGHDLGTLSIRVQSFNS